MRPVLVAIEDFFAGLAYPSQRDVAPDVADDASYIVWMILNDVADDDQANYADEVQGLQVHLRIHCWAEKGGDAATVHDTVEAALRSSTILPTGFQPLKRPRKIMNRPVRDPDGRHHQVVSEWYLRFTKG